MSSVATALRGRVVTPVEIIEDGLVVVAEGHIAWVGAAAPAARPGWGGQHAPPRVRPPPRDRHPRRRAGPSPPRPPPQEIFFYR